MWTVDTDACKTRLKNLFLDSNVKLKQFRGIPGRAYVTA